MAGLGHQAVTLYRHRMAKYPASNEASRLLAIYVVVHWNRALYVMDQLAAIAA
jgi:hypothetical protein